MMSGPPVEVRKNPKSTTWYNAIILDISGENIKVGFEDQIWASREVPAFSVRRCPQDSADDGFDPQVDEVVEVSVAASESNPSGWSLGKVKTIKNSFYFIGFVGTQNWNQDLIVERNALRRVNNEPPVDATKLERRLVAVEQDLQTWIRSPDAPGCLTHVQSKARLLLCSCTNMDPASKKQAEVLLIGDERSVELGEKLLLHIHFKNQVEMQRFHEQREQLMERLQEQQRWYSERNQETFAVEQTLVGRIIGKKGENIKQIRDKYSVEVHLSEASNSGRPTTVTISGASLEDCRKAREELEYITAKIPIEGNAVGWILGKGYQNIQDIAKKADLHYARFDDKTSSLELCGLKHQVEDAKMLISVHREYLAVYKDMDEEQHMIQQSFEELEGAAGERRKGKGKGKDKGKDGKDGGKGEKGGSKGGNKGGYKGHDDDDDDDEDDYPSKGKGRGKGGQKSSGKGDSKGASKGEGNGEGRGKGGRKSGK